MKTKIEFQSVVAIITSLIAAQAFSQGMYINAGAGYGFSAASTVTAYDNSSYDNGSSSTYNAEMVKGCGTFGKGFQVGGAFGYMFNENIGAELGIGYLFGSTITTKSRSSGTDGSSSYEGTLSGKILRLTPAIKITTGNGKVKPYLRTGLIIGMAGKLKETYTYSSTYDWFGGSEDIDTEYSGGISFGFAGGIGADFMFNESIGIFAEVSINTHSWAPKKSKHTKYIEDGIDQLPSMTTSEIETEYVDSYTYTYPNDDTSSPDQELKIWAPFSSVGINVGIKFSFGGKSETKE